MHMLAAVSFYIDYTLSSQNIKTSDKSFSTFYQNKMLCWDTLSPGIFVAVGFIP